MRNKVICYLLNVELALDSEELRRFYEWFERLSGDGRINISKHDGKPIEQPLRDRIRKDKQVEAIRKLQKEGKELTRGLSEILEESDQDWKRIRENGVSLNEVISIWNGVEESFFDGSVELSTIRKSTFIDDNARQEICEIAFTSKKIDSIVRQYSLYKSSKLGIDELLLREVKALLVDPDLKSLVKAIRRFDGERSIRDLCLGNSRWKRSEIERLVESSESLLRLVKRISPDGGRPSEVIKLGFPLAMKGFPIDKTLS